MPLCRDTFGFVSDPSCTLDLELGRPHHGPPRIRNKPSSPLEDPLALILSPTQLGVQWWEGAHTATGLPWWAAIPTTTLLLRGALMPLSLRAYAASANAVAAAAEQQCQAQRRQAQEEEQREGERQLAGKAGGAGVGAPGEQQVGVQTQLGPSSSGSSGTKSSNASGGGNGGGSSTAGAELGRMDVVRRVFNHLRHLHGVPSFGWYLGNTAVQVSLVVSLSLALRRMSDSLWPGFTGEGLLYFQDLTAPPVYLQTLSTPYGTAGAILPLALVLLYVSAADRSAGGSSPGIHIALKLLVVPLYCTALLQPHAVLLYWMAQAASQLGIYELAARLPPLRRAARVPELLLAPRSHTSNAGPTVDEILLELSESYAKAGNTTAARTCLNALLTRQPLHQQAVKRLQALSSNPYSA
ncbi:hypothetical protein VOLCADRAFT_117564 [Volvox carteri f. nagariensis]|uniref:Uncharacterized protein n=1 Tax=Volvox carteri f. nagariensis TaxID=3068 RepID=D8TV63_VOLCA|nr:uncharacterized protein VOLCADRAFT_117564 [Volvox carteri f. nagariensis]EFJ48647.1 hypothetical protein VOLCADRAFT_117564 [Volvox carteri f. nagariensis]|eukprot:XP_002950446.1 hypothetical protein VOLCADRAFT_117564 [Volvox carteri f. nagariensis]